MRRSNINWKLRVIQQEKLCWLRNSIKASKQIEEQFFRIILDNYLYLVKTNILWEKVIENQKGKIFSGSFGVVRPRKSKIVVLSTKRISKQEKKYCQEKNCKEKGLATDN